MKDDKFNTSKFLNMSHCKQSTPTLPRSPLRTNPLATKSHYMTNRHPMRLVSIVVNFVIMDFMKLIKIIASRNWRPKATVLKLNIEDDKFKFV
jgi:hypothetical protein